MDSRSVLLRLLQSKTYGYNSQNRGFKEPPAPANVRAARKVIHRWQRIVEAQRKLWQRRRETEINRVRREIYFGTVRKALELLDKL